MTPSPGSMLYRGFSVLCIAMILAIWGLDNLDRDRRLAEHIHTQALIESTWVQTGKSSGRYAAVSFMNQQGSNPGLCQLSHLRLGPSSLTVSPGQTIEVVPRPGTCAWPDLMNQPTSPAMSWGLLGMAAAFLAGGIWRIRSCYALPASK